MILPSVHTGIMVFMVFLASCQEDSMPLSFSWLQLHSAAYRPVEVLRASHIVCTLTPCHYLILRPVKHLSTISESVSVTLCCLPLGTSECLCCLCLDSVCSFCKYNVIIWKCKSSVFYILKKISVLGTGGSCL